MAKRVRIRRDTAANWASVDPVLGVGELGLDTTNDKMKKGDGTTAWSGLSFYTFGRDKGYVLLTAPGISPLATGGCASPAAVDLATAGIRVMQASFAESDTDPAGTYLVEMPRTWDGGTIRCRFTWMCQNAATDNVVWAVKGRKFADGDAIDQALGTQITVQDANQGAGTVNVSAWTAAVTPNGTAGGNLLALLITRKTSDTENDTLAAAAQLLEVLVEYSEIVVV